MISTEADSPILFPAPGGPLSQPRRRTAHAANTGWMHRRMRYLEAGFLGIQSGSLLLAPSLVICTTSASVAVLRFRMPDFSADTAKMFQPGAYTPTISQAAWKVPFLFGSPFDAGPQLKTRYRLS